jgi:hypothetical protein
VQPALDEDPLRSVVNPGAQNPWQQVLLFLDGVVVAGVVMIVVIMILARFAGGQNRAVSRRRGREATSSGGSPSDAKRLDEGLMMNAPIQVVEALLAARAGHQLQQIGRADHVTRKAEGIVLPGIDNH